ncbi:MAG: winged helix-turn-helix domain-containing protein [Solirubrobacterales bacterium]
MVPGRFSSAAIGIGDGELELRLSDGGNWQVKVRSTGGEGWRMLCRGHIDGTIFETASAGDKKPIMVGPLMVDPAARRVEVRGKEVRLTAHEFEVIALLATDPQRVFTKEELQQEIWGGRGATRTLDSHVSRARVKLRKAGAEGFIVNCWRVGYKLCP